MIFFAKMFVGRVEKKKPCLKKSSKSSTLHRNLDAGLDGLDQLDWSFDLEQR